MAYSQLLWPSLLIILGVAMVLKPKLLWRLEHCFSVRGGKPTDLYLALTRIGGLVFLLLGVFFLGAYVLRLLGA